MKGIIYSLRDPRDSKIKYIGQTRFSINKRYKEHLRNCKYYTTKNHNVYRWINELVNLDLNPIIDIVEKIDITLLDEREKYWISYYDDLKNMTVGGTGIKYINKREFSETHKKKIGDSCRGEKHYNYNKPASNIKPILMFSIDGKFENEFSSIKMASNYTKILTSAISNCLTGKRNSSGEHIWMYKNKYDDKILFEKIVKCNKHPSNKNKSIKISKINVISNEVIETYESYKEAARINNTSDAALIYACNKSKTHVYRNYKWKKQ